MACSRAHGPVRLPTPACALERGRSFSALKALVFLSFFRHFFGCFSVVAAFAQTLVVPWVYEQLPVSPVWFHMIHYGGPGPDAPLSALAAERLPQQLRRTEIIGPDGQVVPAVVLRRHPTAGFLWLMLGTVPFPSQ